MPSQLQAVIASDGGLEVRSMPVPHVGEHEVQVAIAYSGICGTDLHAIGRRIDSADVTPIRPTPGHEQSGVVVGTGAGVTQFAQGDRVALLPRLPCGRCGLCRRGHPSSCREFRRPEGGGWSQSMTLDQDFLVAIPKDLALDHAALAEPTACVLHAIDRAELEPGATALVIGGGPMGLLLASLLPLCGASRVLLSEPEPRRRELAELIGATVLDPSESSLVQWVFEQTEGRGADATFEAAGLPLTVEQAIDATAVSGSVVIVGVADPEAIARLRPHEVFARELTIRGAWGVETTFTRALTMLGRIDPRRIISQVFPLTEAHAAVAAARTGPGKVLIQPNP